MAVPMTDQDSAPSRSELASFGEELRREREIRGISLKEIADATKISKRFLEAIERNDHKTLPAPVFTRGFVREYARYLGLNHEDMVNRYNFAAAGDDRIEKSPHLDRVVQMPQHPSEIARPQPKKGIPPPYARIDRNLFYLVIIVAALAGVSWWAIRHKRAEVEAAQAEASAPVVPIRAPSQAVAKEQAQAAPADDMLRLTIQIVDNSWVTLEADGKTVLNAEMTRGESRTFEAKESFRFRTIGNAAGVALTLNDAKLPPLGDDGEVIRNRVLNREDLAETREPSPEPGSGA